jgi:hypothetical protein
LNPETGSVESFASGDLHHGRRLLLSAHLGSQEEAIMAINWRKDIDKALDDARAGNRHLLLDFSAAPM